MVILILFSELYLWLVSILDMSDKASFICTHLTCTSHNKKASINNNASTLWCREYLPKSARLIIYYCVLQSRLLILFVMISIRTGIQIILNQNKMCVLSRLAEIFEKNRFYARPDMFNHNGCVVLVGAITL